MVATPTRFLTPEDVANRALQHVGSTYITTMGPAGDDTKQNDEVSRVYHKVRRAELRRNVWRFAVRKARLFPLTGTCVSLSPSNWAIGTTYAAGALVTYADGIWQSRVSSNVGQTPGADTSIDVLGSSTWIEYSGPLVIDQWYPPSSAVPTSTTTGGIGFTTTTYDAGDIVYLTSTAEATGPIAQTTLATGGTGYALNDTGTVHMTGGSNDATYTVTAVSSGVVTAYNLTGVGTAYPVTPNGTTEAATTATGGAQPGSGTGLTFNATVNPGGTFTVWRSLVNSNSSNPIASSGQWLQLTFQSLTPFSILYPIGAGPLAEDNTLNVFVLPYGYLKVAPQDPKAGSTSYLGAPSGRPYDDWTFEANYFTSMEAYPINFRFVADTANVPDMDDMFCEGWAARIGVEVCEPLTQSAEKIKTCEGMYRLVMSEARIVNGIETGPTEPPEDDWITCRY